MHRESISIDFNPFPVLTGERLLLRRLTDGDADVVFAMRSDPETMRFIPRPLLQNREEALGHIAMISEKIDCNTGINWAITLKEDPGRAIGIVGHYRMAPEHFRSEIGYMLHKDHHNNGYVSEAIGIVLQYGFEVMKLHSVEAIIDPGNRASARVLEKNGFIKEAHILENEYFDGQFIDTVIYSLLERNWRRRNHTAESQSI